MSFKALRGCGTALVTPFNQDGSIDEGALRALVDWQIEQGIHFLVPCGSTGEAATMTLDEHRRRVSVVVEQVAGRVPVVAGGGSNDTRKAIELSRAMRDAGATHLLHTFPLYNKPTRRGNVRHVQQAAAARNRRALPRDRGSHRSAHRGLQRSRTNGKQHRGEDDAGVG